MIVGPGGLVGVAMAANMGMPAVAVSDRRHKPRRSGRLGVDALVVEQLAQLARGVHLPYDVAAADELALDVELGDGRPLAEVLDALAERRIGQDVDALELDAELAQHLHDGGREAALREHGRALHVEHDVVLADVLLDAIDDRVVQGGVHKSVPFRPCYFGIAVCRARAWSWSPILPRSAW